MSKVCESELYYLFGTLVSILNKEVQNFQDSLFECFGCFWGHQKANTLQSQFCRVNSPPLGIFQSTAFYYSLIVTLSVLGSIGSIGFIDLGLSKIGKKQVETSAYIYIYGNVFRRKNNPALYRLLPFKNTNFYGPACLPPHYEPCL